MPMARIYGERALRLSTMRMAPAPQGRGRMTPPIGGGVAEGRLTALRPAGRAA